MKVEAQRTVTLNEPYPPKEYRHYPTVGSDMGSLVKGFSAEECFKRIAWHISEMFYATPTKQHLPGFKPFVEEGIAAECKPYYSKNV